MKNIYVVLSIVLFAISVFMLAFALGSYFSNDSNIVGFWSFTPTEEFVCVDVTRMDFGKALEVCQHEIGHKICYNYTSENYLDEYCESFAEVCEKDFDKCLEVMK